MVLVAAEVLQQQPLVLAVVLPNAGFCVVVGIVRWWLEVASQVLLVALQYLRSLVPMAGGGFLLCYG